MNGTPHPCERFLREDLRDLQPYHVEPFPHRVKLDANESPYDLPPAVKRRALRELEELPFHRYPDPEARELKAALSKRLDVPAEWLAVGNGSDELIQMLLIALARPGTRVLAPEPTFSMYRILARVAGLPFVGVPLDERFELNAEALRQEVERSPRAIVFLSYPNNPTGNCWDEEVIRDLLGAPNAVFVLDEAYYEFSRRTFLPELGRRSNVLVLRTFSKAFGLAGLRVGILIADPRWIGCVEKVRLPYNVNGVSQRIARIALEHAEEIQRVVETIVAERRRLFEALAQEARLEPFPSEANFLLFRVRDGAAQAFRRLLDAGVLVRNLDRPGPLRDCLRVTVGRREENDQFLKALGVPANP
ncbi:MAG: histidinol-phosphate aminotransferase [Candidatus Poribacteria bacterium]|nr:MAG: histidinol-phosphate aminotransferase [Candidatus Poribacteria bacterium]